MALINFSGIASGIDSEGLIEATSSAARSAKVRPLEDKITRFEDTNTALQDMKSKLSALQSKLRAFTTSIGGPLTKQAGSSDETLVTASASNSASNGSYRLSNITLAKNATISLGSTGATYTTANDPIYTSAVSELVEIDIGADGTSDELEIDLTVTGTTTLADFASAFNTAAGNRATASVVNTGTSTSPSFKIVITANETGTARGSLRITSVDSTLTSGNRFNSNVTSAAVNASFALEGVGTITRSSNTVSDLVPGVTFNLQGATTTDTVTVQVSDDVGATTNKVQEFVDAYNEIIRYMDENNRVTRQEDGAEVSNVFSPLALTRLDENAVASIRGAMSASSYSSGSEYKILADLGITTERDGTLKFDTAVFSTAMSKEPTSVKEILTDLGDTAAVTGGTIDLYIRFNGLFDLSINSNRDQIDDMNERIARAEESIRKQEETMRGRFARLESTLGRLQNQQGALSSALAGLQR